MRCQIPRSRAIAANHTLAARYTWAKRLVAVVSDALGRGDIGPAALLPVMPDEIMETLVPRAGFCIPGATT